MNTVISLIFPSAHAQDGQDTVVTQESYFPSQCSFGTLGFEDLWPSRGDYDFNDLVVNYNVAQNINASDEVVSMEFTFQLIASGAGYDNGFAIELPILKEKVKSVTGNLITDNYINFEGK